MIIKKLVCSFTAAAILADCIFLTTFASNEDHKTYDVTMTVANTVVNNATEKLFGFNQEWDNVGIRRNNWLDKNYSKYDFFNNDFENKTYWFPAMETSEAYLYPAASTTFTYISNADVYGGNLSYTKYGVKSGNNLYDNQYKDGILQKPKKSVDYKDGDNFGFISGDILQTGGIDGYFGFNNYFELSKGNSRYDVQDLTVVDDGTQSGNHVAKLAPPIMTDEYTYKGGGSYFGKTDVALMDRKTTFKYRLKIDSVSSDVRLSIAKDWNIDWIKDAENNKYCLVSSAQFAREQEANQVMGWFDAVKFKDGTVYLAGNSVGEYEKSKWYTVEYTLDACGKIVKNSLRLTDNSGKVIADASAGITLNSEVNMGRDIPLVASMTPDNFEFSERSDYAYVICANNPQNTSVGNGTVAYIDDIDFKTDTYYDTPNQILDPKLDSFSENHTFTFARMAGTTANWFKWKNSVGDVKQRERYSRQSSEKLVKDKRTVWGIPEWLTMVDKMNSEAQCSYVINILDSDEDIANLVEYLTADGDINGDGEDWAAVRKADGHPSPARIYMWEIGNEPNLNYMDPGTWENKWDKESYIKRAGEVVKILKRYSPDIKIGVATNTDYVYNTGSNRSKNWDTDIVKQDWAAQIDYLVVHSYNVDRCTEPVYAIDNANRSVNSADSKNKNIKIAYTEHGTSRPSTRADYYQGIGLASALCEAEFFNRILGEPMVEVANLHSYTLYPGPWGIGYEKDGKYLPGATYMLMDMYAENGVGEVLSSSIDGFCNTLPSNGGPSDWNGWGNGGWLDGKYGYSCAAVKQADGSLNLFINNHRNHTLNLNLALDSAFDDYTITEKNVITGKNADDATTSFDGYSYIYTDETNSSLEYRQDMVYKTEYNLSRDNIEIDPYSVTVIKLKNTAIQNSVASFGGQRRIDVSGKVENAEGKNITLLITDKNTQDILYINQTLLADDDSYRFNFEFDHDLKDCKTLINYCGILTDISGGYESVTDENDMFTITAQITESKIVAEIDNKYNFVNIPYIMLAAAYSSDTPGSVSVSDNAVLSGGINRVQAYADSGAKYHRLFFWSDKENIAPLFKPITLR